MIGPDGDRWRRLAMRRVLRCRGAAWLVLTLSLVALAAAPARTADRQDEARFDAAVGGSWLGVRGAVRSGGFAIASVTPGCAAAVAGLEAGDVIVALAGKESFADVADLVATLRACPPGRAAPVRFRRGDRVVEGEVVPDSAAFADLFAIVDVLSSSRWMRSRPGFQERLDAILATDTARLRAARTWSRAYEVLNEAVGRFELSHLAVVPPWTHERLFTPQALAAGTFRLGCVLARRPSPAGARYCVLSIIDGSPAERDGLLVGDEVVRVNGIDVDDSPRRALAGYESRHPYYVLAVEEGESVALDVRRRPDGPIETLSLRADLRVSELAAMARSVEIEIAGGRVIGSIHLWNLLSPDLPARLRAILDEGEGAGVEGWIIDLRGRGGRADVLERVIDLLEKERRPRVFLQDRDARSAKEILSFRLRGRPGTLVVGEQSAGAVLPSTQRPLPSGASLMVPGDPRAIANLLVEPLEGIGAAVDIEVAAASCYGAGADPIGERGRRALLELLAGVPRRWRF